MMLLALAPAFAQLVNPGFEEGLRGWQAVGHPGIGVGVQNNRGYTIRQSAEGEHYLSIGWRRRSAAPRDAAMRVSTRFDARRYRGRLIRVSALTKAPDFAHRNARLIVSAGGAEAGTPIEASERWRRHSVLLRIPRRAREIEIAFVTRGTGSQLAADDVRVELVRR
ncbi:MAG TPA: hypothetical protein VEX35_03550 [Allosphingosinicella sp.]|nr:hypothetical protein [Allosphingosinicella sp.]